MPSIVYGHTWRKLRLVILERDDYRCQIRGEHCEGAANEVDHIVPLHAGGAWYEPENLRAACGTCNKERNRDTTQMPRWVPSREWW